MGFQDTPVAGEYLVRPAIKSPNYVPGADGWAINADGSAEFNDLTINGGQLLIQDANGDAVASIDAEGTGSFVDVTVVNSPTIMGLDFETEWIEPLPRGLMAYGYDDTYNVPGAGFTAEVGLIEVAALLDNRNFTLYGQFNAGAGGGTGNSIGLNIRAEYSASGNADKPTLASPMLFQVNRAATVGIFEKFEIQIDADLAAGSWRFLLCCQRSTGTGTMQTNTTAVTPLFFSVKDNGPAGQNTGVINDGTAGATDPVQQYITSYGTLWSRSYDGNGDANTFGGATRIYQGNIGDGNGNRKAMVGFDYATIQADLAGATIDGCYITFYYQHWYYNAGGTSIIGTHNSSAGAGPATFSGTTNRVSSGSWPKPGLRQVSLGTTIGAEFRDDTTKGIVIGPGQGGDPLTYYGYAAGAGAGNAPVLTIVYTK